jgi:hypothetical protein
MKTVNFVAGWFGFSCRGIFVSPVSYTIGQGKPLEVMIDPSQNSENEMFVGGAVNLANNPDKYPDGRALLVSQEGLPAIARVLEAIDESPSRIVFEVQENMP